MTPARIPPVDPWDLRYDTDEYVYGLEPNDFLRSVAHRIPAGPVLCLAEGEGRNAVFLAGRGHPVLALDRSGVGLGKAERLARSRGVDLETRVVDLGAWPGEARAFGAVVAIFAHLPREIRRDVHGKAVRSLRPGGVLILEAYTPEQLGLGTGGPRTPELLMSLDELRDELAGLHLEIAREVRRPIFEGRLHRGPSAVVQVLGVRVPVPPHPE